MKALVTGANSFIGSALIEELDTLGFEVMALVSERSSCVNVKGLKCQKVCGDLSDFDSLRKAVISVDYVFHLASAGHVSKPGYFIEHNAKATGRLARAVAEVRPNLTRFVYLSSLAAGGPAESLEPRVESERDRPVSQFGRSKLQGEQELLEHKDEFPISIVRPALVYGPRDKRILVLIQSILRNLMPILEGSTQGGQKYWSAIHVKDLSRGVVQAAVASQEKVPSGEIFYLAADGIHSYQDFMTTIADRLNCDPLKIKIPKLGLQLAAISLSAVGAITQKAFPLNLDRLHELKYDYWICSNAKAKKMLDFLPEFDLSSGMTQAIEWYRKQKWI